MESPPGWYPDPGSAGRQLRYWDGRQWTEQVRPHDAPQPVKPARRRAWVTRVKWAAVATFVALVAVIGVALIRGQEVDEVNLAEGKVTFRPAYTSGSLAGEEVEDSQGDLQRRLERLESEVERDAAGSPDPPQAVDLSGTWLGANGLQYRISQTGDGAVIQELANGLVTAVGSGVVQGRRARFDFQAADGSVGVAELTLTDDRTLSGTFRNTTYGTVSPAVLHR